VFPLQARCGPEGG